MLSRYKKFATAVGIFLIPLLGTAQLDSIRFQADMWMGAANQPYMPHWLVANRFGIFDYDRHQVGLLRASATSYFRVSDKFTLEAALDGVARTSFNSSDNDLLVQQGYVKATYGIFEFTGGRIERTLGTHSEQISSGSLAISGNARPVPQLLLSVPEYADVPFTNGYLEFKGTYAHGWFGQDRYIKNAWLHEKSLYLKGGGKFKLNISAGIVHLVTWGGELPNGNKLPAGLDNYFNVVLAQSATNIDSSDQFQIGEAANAVGDNIGVYDFGVHLKLKEHMLMVYHQTPFEDWTGSRLLRNKDRLLGISLTTKQPNHWLEGVVYEFLSTTYQSGPNLPGGPNHSLGSKDKYGNDYGGRDNYYNNYLYKTGWVYQNQIIGTPLFYTNRRMRLYEPDFVEPDRSNFNFNVVNNRVIAHHFGMRGQFRQQWKYRVLATFTKNLGTYGGLNGGINHWGSIENPDAPYAFRPPPRQHYFLTEIERRLPSNLTLSLAVGVDSGQLYRSLGVLGGIRWSLVKTPHEK